MAMGKMIKLSREQWEAIGSEMGYIKKADIAVSPVLSLRSRLREIADQLEGLDQGGMNDPKLAMEANRLHEKLGQFEYALKGRGS
jgi:hypothetical protein